MAANRSAINRGRFLVVFLLLLTAWRSYAQAPVINTVTPISSYPNGALLITGSGFNSNPAQLVVSFDGVKGSIVTSSDFSIQVTAPPSSRLANIEVVNLATKLSTKSNLKFMPSYGGTTFDPSKMSVPLSFGAADEVFDVCSCDFDGDGKADLAGSKKGIATDLLLLRNTSTVGLISFVSSALSTTTPTFNLACGDLDGDGKPELVATRSGATGNEVYVFKNTGSPGAIAFATVVKLILDPGQIGFMISIRDLNQDGQPEIVVSNSNNSATNVLYVFVNQTSAGVLSFNATPVKVQVTGASTTYGLETQDLDGDQKPEIIVNQFNTNDIFIIKNASTSSQVIFSNVQKVSLPGSLNHLTTADINQDGKLDLAVTSSFGNTVLVLLNTTSGGVISFGSPISFATGDGPFGIDAGDLDGDGDVDLVVGTININLVPNTGVTVLRNDGNNSSPSFTTVTINTGKNSRNVKVVDLDGDGKPDMANTTVASNSLDVIRNMNCFTPAILNPLPISVCPGQTIRLNSIPGLGVANYDWKESGSTVGNGLNPYFDIIAAGNFSVTATSESGACVTTSSVLDVASGAGSIPVGDPATTVSSNSPLCTGGTLQLNTPTIASVSYQWSGPAGFSSTLQNPSLANIAAGNAGSYSVVLSNGTCKTNPVSLSVDVADLQSFSVSSTVPGNTICQGSSLTLSVAPAANYTYQWIKDAADISGQTSSSLLVNQQGAFQIRVTNTILSCSSTGSAINVVVLSVPVSVFTLPATACVNDVVTFANQSTGDSRAALTYSWNFGDAGASATASPTHSYTASQTYSVGLTTSYSGVPSCTSLVTKTISIVDPVVPVISPGTASICPGDAQVLSIAGTFTSIIWSDGDTGITTTINQPGDYTVNTIDQNNCAGSSQITVGTNPIPTLVITTVPDPPIIAPGQPVQLLATGADIYTWSPFVSLDNPAIANPKATPTSTTTYVLTGTLNGGCTTRDSVTIQVNGDISALKIPNVFSPNGDGINDLWVIQGIDVFPDCTMSVFDQEGRKLFEQKGYTNNWNGTYGGREIPEGTYYYLFSCPNKKPLNGHVLVAR